MSTLLEAARWLAEADPIDGVCFCCGSGEEDHTSDCPWLALPRIVAVLEVASALESAAETDPVYADGADSLCWFCERVLDYDVEGSHGHAEDCPWTTLLTALAAEPARLEAQPAEEVNNG